jgi:LuxR family transcriptional regulator, maltose regulon positive regulatory protein
MPEGPSPITKITRPRIRGVFPRERLFRLLDETQGYPATWISAPAGSGKTTLAASYLEDNKVPCLWYQVDEGDGDIAAFFNYLGLAAKRAAPQKRKPLPLLTPEYLQGLPTFTLRYFENLFGRFKPPFALVLDNYQTVPDKSAFHEVITQAVGTIPDGIRVIIVSRHDPPPVLTRLQANGLLKIIGWDQIRLTLEESTGIVPLKSPEISSAEVIAHLHRAADGWVAGLVLMLEGLKRGVGHPGSGKMAREEITDYFGNEFFIKTDKEIQDFFLRTAFLPKITLKAAKKLSGLPQAESILSRLSRNNYFTESQYSTEPVYQYHPLFRDFLMARARETFSPEDLAALLHQAAYLLDEGGQVEAAVSLFRDLGDWPAMVQLMLKEAPSIIAQGRYRTIEEWVDSLPGDLVSRDPWLLYLKGTARFPFDPSGAQPYLERAFEQFSVQGNTMGALLAWPGVVYSIIYRFEDYWSLDRWIQLFPVLPENPEKIIPPEIWIQVVSSMFTALSYRRPSHPETEVWIRHAELLVQGPGGSVVKAQILFQLLHHFVVIGDYEQSLQNLRSLQHLAQSKEALPFVTVMTSLAEATYYDLTGDDGKCLTAVSEGLKTSERTGISFLDCLLLAHGVATFQNLGDLGMAQAMLKRITPLWDRLQPLDKALYPFVQTRQFLLQSELGHAAAQVELGLKTSKEVGALDSRFLTYLLAVQVRHRQGRRPEAWGHLQEARLVTEGVKSKIFEYLVPMIEAYFYFDQGEEARGLVSLRKGLAIGQERGYLNTFIDQPAVTAGLCVKALEEGIEVPYVQEIIRKRRLIPEQSPLHLENWPWPVKINTLGRFELLKDGKPVAFPRKIQKKPLLLLKAVISLGGKNVDEELLMDILWPGADGDQAYNALTTTLSRLRQLLGDQVLEVRAGRVSLAPRTCWVDVWAFEAWADKAEAARGEGFPGDGCRPDWSGLAKAVALYRGPFLAEEGSDLYWAVPLRERLKGRYLHLVEQLGRSLEQAEQWEQAIACYRKGLEVDNLAEDLYRRIMACYGSLGETVKAVKVYRQLKNSLSSVLGIEPSPKTETLYRALTTSQKIHQ